MSLPPSQPVNWIFWPIRALSCLIAASKLNWNIGRHVTPLSRPESIPYILWLWYIFWGRWILCNHMQVFYCGWNLHWPPKWLVIMVTWMFQYPLLLFSSKLIYTFAGWSQPISAIEQVCLSTTATSFLCLLIVNSLIKQCFWSRAPTGNQSTVLHPPKSNTL